MRTNKFTVAKVALVTALAAVMLSGCGAQKEQAHPTSVNDEVETYASAYQQILALSPAIDGENVGLNDVTFGYEDSIAKYGSHIDCFAVEDINKDGTPELIAMTVVNSAWTPVSIITYSDGAVLLENPLEPSKDITFQQMSTAGGAYKLYVCKEGHIHSVWAGDTPVGYMEENNAFAMNGTTLEKVDCSSDVAVDFANVFVSNTEENRNAIK